MGGIFGKDKKPASRITEQDEAILVREKMCTSLLEKYVQYF